MTKSELSHHLTIVSIEMLHLAMEMETMDGALYAAHAQELAGAALIARDWSTEIGIESLAADGIAPVESPPTGAPMAVPPAVQGRCCGTCHYRAVAVCEWMKRRLGSSPVPFWYWVAHGGVRPTDGRSCLAYVQGTSGVGRP